LLHGFAIVGFVLLPEHQVQLYCTTKNCDSLNYSVEHGVHHLVDENIDDKMMMVVGGEIFADIGSFRNSELCHFISKHFLAGGY
jgi:hypothetical protein